MAVAKLHKIVCNGHIVHTRMHVQCPFKDDFAVSNKSADSMTTYNTINFSFKLLPGKLVW